MNTPDHYNVPIDVIDFSLFFLTKEEFIGALKFNALKYFYRQGRKEGTNDSEKCLDYLNWLDAVRNGDLTKEDLRILLEDRL